VAELKVHTQMPKHSRIYSRTKKHKYNFSALSGTLFIYFVIDTIFILGDGLTRLLLRWEKSAPLLSCS
jgi:hypothetical protein